MVTRLIKQEFIVPKTYLSTITDQIGHPSLQMLARDLTLVATQYFRVNPAKRQACFEVPAEIKHSVLHLLSPLRPRLRLRCFADVSLN